MLLETFKADITEGEQQNCELCVIARAASRLEMPFDFKRVTVSQESIYFKDEMGNLKGRIDLPMGVRRYIRKFDRDKKSVAPTVFNLPDSALTIVPRDDRL